uniref:MATA-HMG n=1 Tax=Rhizophagus irregularis TaxID=588596 RepID=A0A1B1EVT6_9GLOM|nr:MATA-HMG [Rhizophagus irregularis]ANQ32925.1 MATA-HMG [Rhizophagus irregularis]ANQ32926.1 MATA-HMG [Rhizophagus irregularis]
MYSNLKKSALTNLFSIMILMTTFSLPQILLIIKMHKENLFHNYSIIIILDFLQFLPFLLRVDLIHLHHKYTLLIIVIILLLN